MKTTLLFLLLSGSCFAQTWQWGIQGGSYENLDLYQETTTALATDADGNVYGISNVGKEGLSIDGNPKTAYGQSGNQPNGALFSFDCDGNYRWSKIIGGYVRSLINDVKTDADGNVYVTGNLGVSGSGQANHFDADLTLPFTTSTNPMDYQNAQTFYIAKYSSSGALLWVKLPENGTSDPYGQTDQAIPIQMEIDEDANLYILAELIPGTFADGAYVNTVPNHSLHVLKYNNLGAFVEGHVLSITFPSNYAGFQLTRMARNPENGDIFTLFQVELIPTETNPTVNGDVLDKRNYLIVFDANGNYLWKYGNTSNDAGVIGDIATDSAGNIYISAQTLGYNEVFVPDTFAGQSFESDNINSDNPYGTVAYVMKFSSTGSFLWKSNASKYGGGYLAPSGMVISGNEVAVSLEVPLTRWSGEVIGIGNNLPNSNKTDVGLVRLNKETGALIGMDSVLSNVGSFVRDGALAADNLGNYFLGGNFPQFLYTGLDTLLNSGGETDFFIAKYGTGNCDCQEPVCSFNMYGNGTPNSVSFVYEGQEVYTSVSWDFGDSTSSTEVSPVHTYAAAGAYDICLTATNSCGTWLFCDSVITSQLSTADFTQKKATLDLYPNPARGTVKIDFTAQANAELQLYDMTGRLVQSYKANTAQGSWNANIANLGAGVYLVVVREGNVVTGQRKLVVK